MAKTLSQIQALITGKADLREIINELADYLEANPGGSSGGGVESVTGDLVDDTDPLNPVVNLNYERDGDNYFIVGDGGTQGAFLDAIFTNNSSGTVNEYLDPVFGKTTFEETGYQGEHYKEAARFSHTITAIDDSRKLIVYGDNDYVELAFKDLADVVSWSIKIDRSNGAITITKNGETKPLVGIDVDDDYANDAAAAAADIPIGGLYHTTGAVKIRRS